MRVIMETLFDAAYLLGVLYLGNFMLQKGRKADHRMLAILSLTLVLGDAFHLIPRMVGLISSEGLAGYTMALGIGKLVTSVTMTVFYVMLYRFIKLHFSVKPGRICDAAVLMLALVRIVLCLFPQNAWTSADAPVIWGIYRNIPFAILGVLIVVLLFRYARKDRFFRWAWLAVTLSFSFYIPVVLWADVNPLIGMLMIPKTCCYVWLVIMGYRCVKADC